MPHIADVTAEIREVPLLHSFATARDTLARQVSRPVVITLTLDDGRTYTGEAVAVEYVTGETPESVVDAVETARTALIGADPARLQPVCARLAGDLYDAPSARAGIEIALFSASAARARATPWALFGGADVRLETDITLPLTDDYLERAVEARDRGFRCFKVKVGSGEPERDLDRLRCLAQALPDASYRIDANQAFEDPGAAVRFLQSALEHMPGLEAFEQPAPRDNLASLDEVAACFPYLVYADESVLSPADALRLVRDTRVRGINVKLMKSGVRGALDIIAIARAAGCRLMIGCMLETRVGIGFALQLACGTGAFGLADLDSHLLLNDTAPGFTFREEGPLLYPETSV